MNTVTVIMKSDRRSMRLLTFNSSKRGRAISDPLVTTGGRVLFLELVARMQHRKIVGEICVRINVKV